MLDQQIENWCRWHWSVMRKRRRQCMSLEGNWRSRQPSDVATETPPARVDQAAAMRVEDAWKTLPFREKFLLKWHYVFAHSHGTVCRDMRKHGLHLNLEMYDAILALARALLHEALVQTNLSLAREAWRTEGNQPEQPGTIANAAPPAKKSRLSA